MSYLNYKNYLSDQEEDKLFYGYIVFFLVFGVIFYDFIHFDWLDEILALFLGGVFVVYMLSHKAYKAKYVLIIFFISIFYLFYSFYIASNSTIAILSDYVIQIKPFIGFFCTLALLPRINEKQKEQLKALCWVIWVYMAIVGTGGYSGINYFFGHLSRYATSATALAFIYLYCSKLDWKTFLQIVILMGIGLLSTRSKFFGFYVIFIAILYLRLKKFHFEKNIKTLLLITFLFSLALLVAWNKVNYYFIEGAFESEETYARPALYMVTLPLLSSYFPFGSGYASYATYYSGVYYSKIYAEYDLENMWGLTQNDPAFIADTFYPSLAQFGIIGVFLFLFFFIWILVKTRRLINEIKVFKEKTGINYDVDNYSIILYSGVLFFVIESSSDATFVQNRGFFCLMIMGLSLAQLILIKKDCEDIHLKEEETNESS